ncbi:metaphase-anaphase transition protein-like protein mlo2 [Xylogone sp. PMI_703]|nr:metaphase-anaphase transition protein-like protein mlo2 [Xylogone sp. PMI_703]
MDAPALSKAETNETAASGNSAPARSQSFSSHKSDDSHTAAEFIRNQLQLEAEAREALPYKFDNCTKPLGPLRQILFACLTCNPPPENPSDPYTAAGICYSCSVQCHGEHTLVELFNKRNFECDCGTTRFPAASPCNIRIDPKTNTKGGVHSETPNPNNKYNQNFRNRFCGCEVNYDPFQQKGTMFQCLGLGTVEDGGCGEDWYHPGCVVGLGPNWYEISNQKKPGSDPQSKGPLPSIKEAPEDATAPETNNNTEDGAAAPGENENDGEAEEEDVPLPPGFPDEDSFEGFICYKCVEANPWIKRYAGAPGFLPAVFKRSPSPSPESDLLQKTEASQNSKKRKAADEAEEDSDSTLPSKKLKEEADQDTPDSNIKDTAITTTSEENSASTTTATEEKPCKIQSLPPAPTGLLSLFFTSDFRTHLCHCSSCFPLLTPFPHLLEEEETYENTLSEASNPDPNASGDHHSSNGGGSIYDLGESALKNVDRVRAIEGVMAYNHLKDKLKPFFQQFAESGKAISAEDIRDYFAKLRGDEEGIREAKEGAQGGE